MMDAVEFVKTLGRMCNIECTKCEFWKRRSSFESCIVWQKEHPEEAVSLVEQWGKEYPIKTRQSEFLKLFPNVETDDGGVIDLLPCELGEVSKTKCMEFHGCAVCRKAFWSEEVEE